MKLKILSYNIHKGFTTWNRAFILEKIKMALRQTNADVLFLQEVLGHHNAARYRIPDHDTGIQFEYLAQEMWPHFAYGKNAIYSEGHHGNAILSKYPIIDWSNKTISYEKREPRGLLTARIIHPDTSKEIILANTHLDLSQKGRDDQSEIIIHELKKLNSTPWILVGDFNDWNKKISPKIETNLKAIEAFKALHENYPATFPSFFPFLSLDRVFLKYLTPIKAQALINAPWKGLSDHLPLYVEVSCHDQ